MAEKTKEELEEEQAQKEAEAYIKENHPSTAASGHNLYANMPIGESKEETEQKKKNEETPSYLAPAGGVAGGYAAYKGFGTKMFKPGESVFKPAEVKPVSPVTSAPAAASNVRIEPHFEGPASGLDHVSGQPHVDPYDARVDEIMQSERGKDKPSGYQKERGHNWETQRESLATKESLRTPGTSQAIVQAGPMTPVEGSRIGVPEHVAREIEIEKAKKLENEARARAQAQVAREQAEAQAKAKAEAQAAEAKKAAEAKMAAEKAAQAEAQRKAEEQAAKEASRRGLEKGVAKVATGVLGGALAAPDFYEAYQEYKKNGMTDEAIIKMLQGAGGAAMAIPHPVTELGGLGLNLAAPYLVKQFGPHNKPRQAQ
jgi:hypothetical protein